MMDNKVKPHHSIIKALESEKTDSTPFSKIPLFIKKYIITKENQEKLVSILSSIGQKEVNHLNTRVDKITNTKKAFDLEVYDWII